MPPGGDELGNLEETSVTPMRRVDLKGMIDASPQGEWPRYTMPHVSTKEAALALGVSESSIRRWVDRGALPCERTEGGHRRIRTADLISYARSHGLRLRRGAAASPPRQAAGIDSALERLTGALVGADFASAESVLLSAYTAGSGLGHVFDELVAPAIAGIGERWKGGREGILAEHSATAVASAVIRRLRDLEPLPTGPAAVGGAIEGDPYSMPSQMTDTLLHGLGYSSFDLGANTPVATIGEAAVRMDADIAWISINSVVDPVTAQTELIDTLTEHASGKRRFVVGGRALGDLDLPPIEHVHHVGSMRELEAVAARF